MDKGTLVRTILLGITWLNVVLEQNGLQPIPVLDDETVALGLAFFTSIYAWFRNNYITARGQQQKEVLKRNGLTNAK